MIVAFFLWASVLSITLADDSKPNIVFILADDLGWTDVSYHGLDQVITRNIDVLAYNGIVLQQYYTDVTGSASRAALLTGKYAMRMGLQGQSLRGYEDNGLPLKERLLPSHLRDLGYSTHLVGKWNLGLSRTAYLPTNRGFDSFFGFYTNGIDYYTHDHIEISKQNYFGLDLHDNTRPAADVRGYATELFTNQAVNIINAHNNSAGPFFLQVAHAAPHTGLGGAPLQAPTNLLYANNHIANPGRLHFAAMVQSLDESVGKIVTALAETNLLNNTFIIFASDNGGVPIGDCDKRNYGLNLPFRGMADTPWDGAARVPAVIWHSSFQSSVWSGLFHVSDWFPTILSIVGGKHIKGLDGIDQWHSIVHKSPSKRNEILITLNDIKGYAAYRLGNYKVIVGNAVNDSGFYGSDLLEMKSQPPSYEEAVMEAEIAKIISEISSRPLDASLIAKKRNSTRLYQNRPIEDVTLCLPTLAKGCMFNLKDDPFEIYDVWDSEPKIVKQITVKLRKLWSEHKPRKIFFDDRSKPSLHDYKWEPWMDGEPFHNYTLTKAKFPLEISLRDLEYVVDKNIETFKDKIFRYVNTLSSSFMESMSDLFYSEDKPFDSVVVLE